MTIERLSEIETEMDIAGCVEHTELMKELHNIAIEAMNHNRKEVLDKIQEILFNVSNYE